MSEDIMKVAVLSVCDSSVAVSGSSAIFVSLCSLTELFFAEIVNVGRASVILITN